MERNIKRTITEVLNRESGEYIEAEKFFKKPLDEIHAYRSELQKAIEGIRDELFVCYYCKQKIRIRGGIGSPEKRKVEIFHFAHLKDSDECHIKTKNRLSKEECDCIKYNGEKESKRHIELKTKIAECLRRNELSKKEVTAIQVEEVIKDRVAKEWKKPDINAYFLDKRIAIELQLSTTWLDVITRRQHFYKEQGIFMFWVFCQFDLNDESRKLAFNDVIYTNNQNAYVFDEETYEKSKAEGDLVLKCYYKTYQSLGATPIERWESAFIKLSDLNFDKNSFKIYFHDSENEKKKVEEEIKEHIEEEEEKKRQRILIEQERVRILEEERIRRHYEEAEKQKKVQSISLSITEIDRELNNLHTQKTKSEYEVAKRKTKIDEKSKMLNDISEYSEKTVKYLKGKTAAWPLDDLELYDSLKKEFSDVLKNALNAIDKVTKEQQDLRHYLSSIDNLETIEIGGVSYKNMDNRVNWKFIKSNYKQVSVILRKFVFPVKQLFAENEFEAIDENRLDALQHNKDYLFLMDFSLKIDEFKSKIESNQKIIEEQEQLITSTGERITKLLKEFMEESIEKLKSEVEKFTNDGNELTNVLRTKEEERKERQKNLIALTAE